MRHLPAFHDVRGRIVVIVGFTAAADAKAELAAKAGASLRRVSALDAAALADAVLVFIATGDRAADERAAAAARLRGLPVNVVDRPDLGTFVMGAVVDRDPVTIAISTAGTAPTLAQHLRRVIEAAVPAGFGRLASVLGAARVKIRRAAAEPAARRQLYEQLMGGEAAHLALAGRDEQAAAALDQEIAAAHLPRVGAANGRVHLVGAGPGDPDLLTVKALRLLGTADVVVYDRLVGPAVLDRVRRDAERIYVGKSCGAHSVPQAEIGALLVRLARAGKTVVRLKGGDPFVFGRGGEEADDLRAAGIPFDVVPGITAANGCAAASAIPLTHRDHARALVLVTAHTRAGRLDVDWDLLLRARQTVVIYMGLGALPDLAAGLIARGMSPHTPIAAISSGTLPQQRTAVGTLARLPDARASGSDIAPTLFVLGSVASFALADGLRAWTQECVDAAGKRGRLATAAL